MTSRLSAGAESQPQAWPWFSTSNSEISPAMNVMAPARSKRVADSAFVSTGMKAQAQEDWPAVRPAR